MRKRLGVAAAMTAAFAFGIVGTASAQATCPANDERPAATSDAIAFGVGGWDVAGSLEDVGYGQANVDENNVGYSGTLNGDDIGYGDIDARLIGGPSGEADGEVDGVVSASGSLSGTSLAIQVDPGTGGDCITIP